MKHRLSLFFNIFLSIVFVIIFILSHDSETKLIFGLMAVLYIINVVITITGIKKRKQADKPGHDPDQVMPKVMPEDEKQKKAEDVARAAKRREEDEARAAKRRAEEQARMQRRLAKAKDAQAIIKDIRFTFGDLKRNKEDKEDFGFPYNQKDLGMYTELFFQEAGIGSSAGSPLNEEEKIQVIDTVLRYAMCRVDVPVKRMTPDVSVHPGEIVVTYYDYYIEVPCYDGGNCGTDYEKRTRRLIFRWNGQDKKPWEDYQKEWKEDFIEYASESYKGPEDCLEYWLSDWTYIQPLGNENVSIVILNRGSRLILKDPFGLKGVYTFEDRRY